MAAPLTFPFLNLLPELQALLPTKMTRLTQSLFCLTSSALLAKFGPLYRRPTGQLLQLAIEEDEPELFEELKRWPAYGLDPAEVRPRQFLPIFCYPPSLLLNSSTPSSIGTVSPCS